MTVVNADSFLQDGAPIELRVKGKEYLVSPPDFERALLVSGIVQGMAEEYRAMLSAGDQLVTRDKVDEALDMVLQKMEFEGWFPDWACRAQIKRAFKREPLAVKIRFVQELAKGFYESLLSMLGGRDAAKRKVREAVAAGQDTT